MIVAWFLAINIKVSNVFCPKNYVTVAPSVVRFLVIVGLSNFSLRLLPALPVLSNASCNVSWDKLYSSFCLSVLPLRASFQKFVKRLRIRLVSQRGQRLRVSQDVRNLRGGSLFYRIKLLGTSFRVHYILGCIRSSCPILMEIHKDESCHSMVLVRCLKC